MGVVDAAFIEMCWQTIYALEKEADLITNLKEENLALRARLGLIIDHEIRIQNLKFMK